MGKPPQCSLYGKVYRDGEVLFEAGGFVFVQQLRKLSCLASCSITMIPQTGIILLQVNSVYPHLGPTLISHKIVCNELQIYRIYSCLSQPFTTKKSAQKIALDLYRSHTQRPDQAVREFQHKNCLKCIRNNCGRFSSVFGTFFVNKKV